MSESKLQEKVKKVCTSCQRVFEVERKYGYQRQCPACFRRDNANFAGRKATVAKRDGSKAEVEPSNVRLSQTETTGFTDDAELPELTRLLESCWVRVHEFKVKPNEEQAASLAATLFIARTRRREW